MAKVNKEKDVLSFRRRLARFTANAFLTLLCLITVGCSPASFFGMGNRRIPGSGILARSTLALDDFRALELQFHGNLVVERGADEQIIIEAEDNLLPYLQAQVTDGILVVSKVPPNVTLDTTMPVRYYLTVTELESLATTSGGDIDVPLLEAERICITTKSSGSIHVGRAMAARLEVTVLAAGSVSVDTGVVEEQSVTLSSSGSYHGQGLNSQRATVRLSSSGDAFLAVRQRLDADLSSSGKVYLLGNPSLRALDTSSEGTVIRLHQ